MYTVTKEIRVFCLHRDQILSYGWRVNLQDMQHKSKASTYATRWTGQIYSESVARILRKSQVDRKDAKIKQIEINDKNYISVFFCDIESKKVNFLRLILNWKFVALC